MNEIKTDSLQNQVKALVNKIFVKIPALEKMYIRTRHDGFRLVIVHNVPDIDDAFTQLNPGIQELENTFPEIYFVPWHLHVDEVEDRHIAHTELIYVKSH